MQGKECSGGDQSYMGEALQCTSAALLDYIKSFELAQANRASEYSKLHQSFQQLLRDRKEPTYW